MIAVSIVSHLHGALVCRLVAQLIRCQEVSLILVTLNVPEVLGLPEDRRIRVLPNLSPRGFSANHNAAFQESKEEYFCPLNPDIELLGNPFTGLLAVMTDTNIAMAAPRVDSPAGLQEDSWRRFPTVFSLIRKILGIGNGSYLVPPDGRIFSPEWVAGMCMLFRSADYRALGGFDEGFFLYYEDVDICVRLWKSGRCLVVCPGVTVIHDARRDSHRNFRHLRWHLASITRYFLKHWGRLPSISR